jgi:hypothetical protein
MARHDRLIYVVAALGLAMSGVAFVTLWSIVGASS